MECRDFENIRRIWEILLISDSQSTCKDVLENDCNLFNPRDYKFRKTNTYGSMLWPQVLNPILSQLMPISLRHGFSWNQRDKVKPIIECLMDGLSLENDVLERLQKVLSVVWDRLGDIRKNKTRKKCRKMIKSGRYNFVGGYRLTFPIGKDTQKEACLAIVRMFIPCFTWRDKNPKNAEF